MSSFDDEFGLFGDEKEEEQERRSTLGARKIASSETVIDDVEPEDEPAPRRVRDVARQEQRSIGERPAEPRRFAPRAPKDPQASQARATALLEFLTKRLVSKPDAVEIEAFAGEHGEPVVEVVVDPEDLGKVIGRGGRVAHALRTIVRATAEERLTVDFFDLDELEEEELEDDETGNVANNEPESDEDEAEAGPDPAK